MSTLPVTIEDVRRAEQALAGAIAKTPLVPAPSLSNSVGCEVWLKLETQHSTGSFKERGALNKLLTLNNNERGAGVVAMSAGNHAQGVAYHARRLGIPATIVMPEGTPFTKIDRTQSLGARRAADALARDKGLVPVHPYDDADVIAGQGTIALELLAERPDLEMLIVPIGGGGLISGIAVAAKALNPKIEIVGVQSSLYPSMRDVVHGKTTDIVTAAATLAEGIAVKEPGRLTRRVVAALVADILLVEDAEIERAIEHLIDREKLVAEGAGAAGIAALLAHPERFRGKRIAIVITGGNIDARLLASVLMRGLVREGCLVRLRSELPDVPGALSRVAGVVGSHGGNIVEVHHQRLFQDSSVKRAELDLVIETQSRRHVSAIVAALIAAGFPTQLLSASGDREIDPPPTAP
jgi:threonine dehydratase